MRRLLVPLLLGSCLAPPVNAAPQDEAVMALHVRPRGIRANGCVPTEAGGAAPSLVPCTGYATRAKTGESYDVYLCVAKLDVPAGLTALACGVDYDGRTGKGVDIFAWRFCGWTDLGGTGPNGIWPASGSANQMLWNLGESCQRGTVPGFEDQGGRVIAGSFYVYAYDADVLRIQPPAIEGFGSQVALVDCLVNEIELQDYQLPRAAFSSAALDPGCNPCLEPCALKPACAVTPTVIDVGDVPLGESADRLILVSNAGPGQLRLKPRAPCPQFAIISETGPRVLQPGEETEVIVRYTPLAPGTFSCAIEVGNVCDPILMTGTGFLPGPTTTGNELREPETPVLFAGTAPGDPRPQVGFRLDLAARVRLDLFDVSGRLRRTILDEERAPGTHLVPWSPAQLSSGVYFYRLTLSGGSWSARTVLLR